MKRLVWLGLFCLVVASALGFGAWLGAGALLAGQARPGGDRLVLDRNGAVIANQKHPDLRRGPDLAPGRVPPLVRDALLAAEDKRFFLHPGVDPVAVGRAAWQNLSADKVVSGGSTLTMQLVRLLRPAHRTIGNKIIEAYLALGLEMRLSKEEILRRYLNNAPFGGPVVGLTAACREYLFKSPQRLTPAEAALLSALPQNPSRLRDASGRPALLKRRDRILNAMSSLGSLTPAARNRALAEPLPDAPPALVAPAPHFARYAASLAGGFQGGRIATTLDANLQKAVLKTARDKTAGLADKGIRQAAVLVIDNRSMEVLAWVGSLDFYDPAGGRVDGVLARRQPGSTLKPMIYGMALSNGADLSDRIEDEPLGILAAHGAFRPLDYDRRTRGPVSLRVALASSLNLPALRLTADLGTEEVLAGLRNFGLRLPREAAHYGLGLALGNGESSLLELCTAYAALANGGLYRPARLLKSRTGAPPKRVLDTYSCRLVADTLSDDSARSLGFGRHGTLELPFPAAVKTGTSQRHRDNWCVGFTSRYTVGVWVGNFEGRPMRGVSGVTGAAPLWRAVMLHLHRDRPGRLPPWPPGMERREVCLQRSSKGDCLARGEEYFAPRPQRTAADSAPFSTGGAPVILAPLHGAVYAMDPDLPDELQFLPARALLSGPRQENTGLLWSLDGKALAGSEKSLENRLPLTPGRHRVEVSLHQGGMQLTARAEYLVLP